MNSVILSLGSTLVAPPLRHSGRLGHGLRAGQAHQGPADVDALHQDDAAGRRADPDLSHLPRLRAARYARRPDRGAVPAQSADHRLDALSPTSRKSRARSSKRRAWTAPRSWKELVYVLTPMAVPGIASTLLLNFILAWNEAFWTLNLTTTDAAPLTAVHRLLFQPGGPVLGQALGRLDHGHRAHPGARLVRAAPTCARPHIRRGEMRWAPMQHDCKNVRKAFGDVVIIPDADLDIEQRRVRRLRRAVGLRQVHAAAADRRARGCDRRRIDDRRRRRAATCRRPSAASPWCSSPMRSIRI